MSAEVLYEKRYPRTDLVVDYDQVETDKAVAPNESNHSFEEMLKRFYADTTYVLIPDRVKASEDFVRVAIEVSELYELDTKITRHLDHISVDYSFDCGGGMRDINHVFGMADQFSFFKNINGRDITVSLDFFTHAVVRNGRVVAP